MDLDLCVCVCVCVRERERESSVHVCVHVRVCMHLQVWKQADYTQNRFFRENLENAAVQDVCFMYSNIFYMHTYVHAHKLMKFSPDISRRALFCQRISTTELYMQLWPQSCSHFLEAQTQTRTYSYTDIHTHTHTHTHTHSCTDIHTQHIHAQTPKGLGRSSGNERII